MVPLAPFCPTNPGCPCSPTGPVSPTWPCWPLLPCRKATNEQACTNRCPNRCGIWQFKHSTAKLYLKRNLNAVLMEVTDLPVCLQLQQRNIQLLIQGSKLTDTWKWKVCFAPIKWADKPFRLACLFLQFCLVYPPDPGKWKSKGALSGKKVLSLLEVKEIRGWLLRHLPWPPQVQEAQLVLPFLSGQFHLCPLWRPLDQHHPFHPGKNSTSLIEKGDTSELNCTI